MSTCQLRVTSRVAAQLASGALTTFFLSWQVVRCHHILFLLASGALSPHSPPPPFPPVPSCRDQPCPPLHQRRTNNDQVAVKVAVAEEKGGKGKGHHAWGLLKKKHHPGLEFLLSKGG